MKIYQKRIDLYTGGQVVQQYIRQHPYETAKEYAERQDVYSYINFLRKIVNYYTFLILRSGFKFNIDDNEIKNANFFSPAGEPYRNYEDAAFDILKYFLVCGKVYIYKINVDVIKTEYYIVPPSQAYEVIDDNGYKAFYGQIGINVNSYPSIKTDISAVQNNDVWIVTLGSEVYTYPKEESPVYNFYIDEDKDGLAETLISDAINIQETILNLQSLLNQKFIFGSFDVYAFPLSPGSLPVYNQNSTVSGVEAINKPKRIMYHDAGSEPKILTVDVEFIKQMREYLLELKHDMEELTSQRIRDKAMESGIAKAIDEDNYLIPVRYFATLLETWLSKILSDKFNRVIDVEVNKQFDIYSTESRIEAIRNVLKDRIITVPEIRKELESKLVELLMKTISSSQAVDDIDKIYKSVDTTIMTVENQAIDSETGIIGQENNEVFNG